MKKLCYVQKNKLYFTEKELSEQWGDDWDDYSYQLNAGLPYEDEANQIQCIYIESGPRCSSFLYPSDEEDVEYCVKDINERATPWVTFDFYGVPREVIKLYAGISLEECIKLLLKYECKVFVERRLRAVDKSL